MAVNEPDEHEHDDEPEEGEVIPLHDRDEEDDMHDQEEEDEAPEEAQARREPDLNDRTRAAGLEHKRNLRRAQNRKKEAVRSATNARAAVQQAEETIEAQRTLDANRQGSFNLVFGIVAVLALVVTDSFPAWMASQALGEGIVTTVIVTVLLVLALAGFAALMGHFQRDRNGRRFATAGLLAAGVIILEGCLRLEYLLVTTTSQDPLVSSLLQVGLYTAITAGLTWASYEVLKHIESTASFENRWALKKAKKNLGAANSKVEEAQKSLDRTIEAYASFKDLMDDDDDEIGAAAA